MTTATKKPNIFSVPVHWILTLPSVVSGALNPWLRRRFSQHYQGPCSHRKINSWNKKYHKMINTTLTTSPEEEKFQKCKSNCPDKQKCIYGRLQRCIVCLNINRCWHRVRRYNLKHTDVILDAFREGIRKRKQLFHIQIRNSVVVFSRSRHGKTNNFVGKYKQETILD